jgi:hypothetical protein
LLFHYSHFKQRNPHCGSLLAAGFDEVSTAMLKMKSEQVSFYSSLVLCG